MDLLPLPVDTQFEVINEPEQGRGEGGRQVAWTFSLYLPTHFTQHRLQPFSDNCFRDTCNHYRLNGMERVIGFA